MEADIHLISRQQAVEATKKEESGDEDNEEVGDEELIEEVDHDNKSVSSFHNDKWGACPSNSGD